MLGLDQADNQFPVEKRNPVCPPTLINSGNVRFRYDTAAVAATVIIKIQQRSQKKKEKKKQNHMKQIAKWSITMIHNIRE